MKFQREKTCSTLNMQDAEYTWVGMIDEVGISTMKAIWLQRRAHCSGLSSILLTISLHSVLIIHSNFKEMMKSRDTIFDLILS